MKINVFGVMKPVTSALMVMLLASNGILAGNIEVRPGQTNELKLLDNSWHKVTVQLSTAEIRTLEVTAGEQTYTRLLMPAYSRTDVLGSPELPVRREFLEVPVGAAARVEITRAVYKDLDLTAMGFLNPVFPAQAPASKGEDVHPFAINSSAYQVDDFFPGDLASFEVLGFMRSYRMGRLDIFPVHYNPVTHILRVYEEIEVTVHFDHGDVSASIDLKQKYENFYFKGIGRTMLNYQPLANRDTVATYPITYVIVSDPMFQSQLEPFVAWKAQQGFKVIEAYTNDPQVGSSTATIKNYIHGLYTNPAAGFEPPSFVLFVGDVAQVPAWNGTSGSHVTDLYYCEYSNDLMPEIYYGRFSATNPSQLQPQIDKTIQYEKFTMPDPSYLEEVVMIAGMDGTYAQTWANGQINYGTINYFNESNGILSHTYLYPESGSHDDDIIQDISNGVTFANYTAHGSEQGWADPSFSISDIATLQNQDQYGLLVGNCCLTSRYDYGECFAEALLRAANKGAVGYIGGSNNTYWDEDYYFGVGVGEISEIPPPYEETTLGNYDRAFHTHGEPWEDWYTTMHQHVYAGNLAVMLGSPGSATYYWEIYNTMGDPSLMIYYGFPEEMTATYMPLMPLGTTDFTVDAAPYAYVGISVNGELKGAALADAQGTAVVPVDPITTPCIADIVVTAQNRQPFFGTVIVANPEGPFILMSANEEVELAGIINNKIEPGEVIGISIELHNYGQSDGTDVMATLSTMDEFVSISDATEACGTVPALSTKEIANAFSIIIHADIPDGHIVEFVVTVQDPSRESWSSEMTLLLSAPVLKLNSLVIDDSEGGNGNGRLDPGENVEITATFSNQGHAVGRNTTAGLCAHSGFIDIANPLHTIGNLGLFGTTPVTFNVSVDTKAPVGILAEFIVNLTAEAYELYEIHPMKIGMICEDFETGDFSKFPWNQGGNLPWTIVNQYPYEGYYSIKSGSIGHGQSSEISMNYTVMQGDSITFFRKVSSEPWDSLKFLVDGIVRGAWSGNAGGWKRASFYIAPGNHMFKWAYIKNGNGTAGADAAWIDYIVLPPGPATTIYAGEDASNCTGSAFHQCLGMATQYQSVTWATSGTGTFDDDAILIPLYYPSPEDYETGEVTLTLQILSTSGEAFSDEMILSFLEIPASPEMPSGPDLVLVDTTYISEYTTDPVENAGSYQWMVLPEDAGIFTGSGTTGTIVWNRGFAGTAQVGVLSVNQCGSGFTSPWLEVTVENTAVGFDEPDAEPFRLLVYPNPVTDILTLECSGELYNKMNFMILDIMGKVVVPPLEGYNPWRVPLNHLSPGIYILIVQTNNHQITRKIIVR